MSAETTTAGGNQKDFSVRQCLDAVMDILKQMGESYKNPFQQITPEFIATRFPDYSEYAVPIHSAMKRIRVLNVDMSINNVAALRFIRDWEISRRIEKAEEIHHRPFPPAESPECPPIGYNISTVPMVAAMDALTRAARPRVEYVEHHCSMTGSNEARLKMADAAAAESMKAAREAIKWLHKAIPGWFGEHEGTKRPS